MGYALPYPFAQVIQPITHDDGGERCSVSYGIQVRADDFQAAVNEADGDFVGAFAQFLDTAAQFEQAVMYYRASAGGPLQAVFGPATPTAGTSTANQAPPNVAWILRKRTNFVGRRYRGRMYFPWSLSETAMNELGVLTPAAISTRQGAANDWLDAADVATAYEGLWLLHNETGTAAENPDRISTFEVAQVVGTQRRRLQRGA